MKFAIDYWRSADDFLSGMDSKIRPSLGGLDAFSPIPHMEIPFNLMNSVNAVDNFGSVLEARKASGWDKAVAGGNAAFQTGMSAVSMYAVAAPAATALAEAQEASAASRALSKTNCFVAGTQVQVVSANPLANSKKSKLTRNSTNGSHATVLVSATSTGTAAKINHNEGIALKPIEQIRKGDLVLTRNEKTGKSEVKKVLRTTILSAPAVVTLSFADSKTHKVVETITATREHPFMVEGVGFVIAGRLALGNAIVTRAGPALTVAKIDWKQGKQPVAVYNFEVERTILTSSGARTHRQTRNAFKQALNAFL